MEPEPPVQKPESSVVFVTRMRMTPPRVQAGCCPPDDRKWWSIVEGHAVEITDVST